MNQSAVMSERKMTSVFERYLTVWVALSIIGGIVLGKIAPRLAKTFDGMSIDGDPDGKKKLQSLSQALSPWAGIAS